MHLNPKAAPGKGEREGVQGGMCSNIRSLQTDKVLAADYIRGLLVDSNVCGVTLAVPGSECCSVTG